MDINLCIFVGRLVKDPVEIPISFKTGIEPAQNECVELCLAINRPGLRLTNKADYVNIRVWGALAKAALKYCRKGKELGVIGEFQTTDYSENGGKFFHTVKGKYISFGHDTDEVRKKKAEKAKMAISEADTGLVVSLAGALMEKLKDISPDFGALPGVKQIGNDYLVDL